MQAASLISGDRLIGPAIRQGIRERGFAASVVDVIQPGPRRYAFPALAEAGGKLLARPDGPRIAAFEIDGWDTHTAQVPRLRAMLTQLDVGLAALKRGLGPAWRRTVVLCMTEFGRTARVNGTKGTDHGTGTVAFVLGAPLPADAFSLTGPVLHRAGCWRTAIYNRRSICARSPRPC